MNCTKYTIFLCLAGFTTAIHAMWFEDAFDFPSASKASYSRRNVTPQIKSITDKQTNSIKDKSNLLRLQLARRNQKQAHRKLYLENELQDFENSTYPKYPRYITRCAPFFSIVVSKKDHAILNGTYHK